MREHPVRARPPVRRTADAAAVAMLAAGVQWWPVPAPAVADGTRDDEEGRR